MGKFARFLLILWSTMLTYEFIFSISEMTTPFQRVSGNDSRCGRPALSVPICVSIGIVLHYETADTDVLCWFVVND